MEMNKPITLIVCLVIGVIMITSVLVPVVETGSMTQEGVHNDGAGWLRFDLNNDANVGYDVHVVIDEVADTFSVVNGTDTQTYDNEGPLDFETILYADSNVSVWIDDDTTHILGTSNGSPFYAEGWGNLDIVRTSEGVSIGLDDDTVPFGVPTWAYVPVSTGSYGFFMDGTEVVTYPNDMPVAAVGGGFAGVYAYDNHYLYDGLGLVMSESRTEDGKLNGVSWAKAVAEDENEDSEPLGNLIPTKGTDTKEPVVKEQRSEDSGGLRAVPTPTYSDGDWGYDTTTVDGVTKAIIVSYSGAGGDIVVPATVGGYDVYRFGKSAPNDNTTQQVFNTSSLPSTNTLTFSDGIVQIGANCMESGGKIQGNLIFPDSVTEIGIGAFYSVTSFNGYLKLPKNLTYLGASAFYGCSGLKGDIIIPSTLTKIDNMTFRNCSGFDGTLYIPSNVTTISSNAFNGCSHLTTAIFVSDATPSSSSFSSTTAMTTILDLSDSVIYAPGSYGISSSAVVEDNIGDCLGYISVADIQDSGNNTVADLLNVLPLVMGAGMVLFTITMLKSKE